MIKLKVGDVVVEPTIGICTVEGVRRMKIDQTEEDYYIFQSGNTKVLVPKGEVEKRGIRKPMSKEEVKKIFSLLKVPVTPNRSDAKMQYLSYREIMKSGDPQKITKLLRDLYTLDQTDELKGKEKEIMEQARKFLCDEITYIKGQSKTKVIEDINESLRAMYKKKIAKEREKAKKSQQLSSSPMPPIPPPDSLID